MTLDGQEHDVRRKKRNIQGKTCEDEETTCSQLIMPRATQSPLLITEEEMHSQKVNGVHHFDVTC